MIFTLVFGWGGQKADEIIVSRLRLKSLEDTVVYVLIFAAFIFILFLFLF